MNRETKIGLALSGGGFRASFFHVGVLARLAEAGLLRLVEVISTVSGGSIVGALYYLHVKNLLEQKPDSAISDADYIGMVARMSKEFQAAVEKNFRMWTFLNPWKNLKMARAEYSRSDHIAELYDQYLYRPAFEPGRKKPIEMAELKIAPNVGNGRRDSGFYPATGNKSRKAKVPILLINATALNNGHNWRFEAAHMGCPRRDGLAATDVDKNLRLEPTSAYETVTRDQQDIRLGDAVAASACVPGIFHPLAISGLYEPGIRVQLVDGGVHDNQGLQGLLDSVCTHFIVSDASGQLKDETDPDPRIDAVVGRTNNLLMARVRQEELCRLMGECGENTAFVHLRRGLSVGEIPYQRADGSPGGRKVIAAASSQDFGVEERVQKLLSEIRTDLDSFTEVEAYSLMADGYLMMASELRPPRPMGRLTSPAEAEYPWEFLRIRSWLGDSDSDYRRQLHVAAQLAFKAFRLNWPLTIVCLALLLGGLSLWISTWNFDGLTAPFAIGPFRAPFANWLIPNGVIAGVFGLAGLLFLVDWASRTFHVLRGLCGPAETMVRFLGQGLWPFVISLVVWIHVFLVDPLFLRCVRLNRLEKADKRARQRAAATSAAGQR
jgi:predicted acylesterase/phospholipase RssA